MSVSLPRRPRSPRAGPGGRGEDTPTPDRVRSRQRAGPSGHLGQAPGADAVEGRLRHDELGQAAERAVDEDAAVAYLPSLGPLGVDEDEAALVELDRQIGRDDIVSLGAAVARRLERDAKL